MNNTLDHIALKNVLSQSEFAKEQYNSVFSSEPSSFSNPLLEYIEEIYNKIIKQCEGLSQHQIKILNKIINSLNEISLIIDPNRLDNIQFAMTKDGDLLIYRETNTGLTNIIIHPEDDFAFSYIGNKESQKLDFFEYEIADYEKIIYNFLEN